MALSFPGNGKPLPTPQDVAWLRFSRCSFFNPAPIFTPAYPQAVEPWQSSVGHIEKPQRDEGLGEGT